VRVLLSVSAWDTPLCRARSSSLRFGSRARTQKVLGLDFGTQVPDLVPCLESEVRVSVWVPSPVLGLGLKWSLPFCP
uniref:Uncharacterized protein n=1 Tax=Cannabis sativa TaxID=3483 RepID=A0A803QRC4_CANSA